VEWCWQVTLSLCHSVHQTSVWSIGGMILTGDTITVPQCPPNISVEHWWNDADRWHYHCATVSKTSHKDWPGIELNPPQQRISISVFYWNYMNTKWKDDGVIVSLQLCPMCVSHPQLQDGFQWNLVLTVCTTSSHAKCRYQVNTTSVLRKFKFKLLNLAETSSSYKNK